MSTLFELTYGGVLAAVLAQQIGLPVPSVVFLMAAGAHAAHRGMHPVIIIALSVLACLTGDGVWFCIGRRWGSKAMRVLCRFTGDPRNCSKNAKEKFQRHGLRLLAVAKFLPGLDAVMPPLAGAEGAPVLAFLAVDAAGSLLWSAAYVGLGFAFSKELDLAIHWVQNFGTALGIGIAVPIALYVGWRVLVLARMIHERAPAPHQPADARAQAEIE
jgi:membrane protein DedA with SNARE-associated domain